MKTHNLSLLLVLFVGLLVLGCATSQTGWKAYNLSQEGLNTIQNQYIAAFKSADVETQNKWREKYTPMFREANEVLDDWEFALLVGDPTAEIELNYTRVKRRLLDAILEVEGGGD
jgi:hypothetical protein